MNLYGLYATGIVANLRGIVDGCGRKKEGFDVRRSTFSGGSGLTFTEKDK